MKKAELHPMGRKKSEKTLPEHGKDISIDSDVFQQMLEQLPQGVLVYRDFIPLYANRALLDLFGYGSFPELLDAGDIFTLIGLEAEPATEPSAGVGEIPQGLPGEYRLVGRRKDQTALWVEFQTRNLSWEDGPAILATVKDISPLMEALQGSEGNFRQLMDHAAEGIFLLDRNAQILLANAFLCNLLGYEAGELDGLNFADLVEPGDLAAKPLNLKEAYAGKNITTGRLLVKKDGTALETEISGNVRGDGLVQGFVRDITERKETERKLAESGRLMQSVFDSIPFPVHVKDRERKFLKVNAQLAKLFDLDVEYFIGKTLEEIPTQDEKNSSYILELDQRVLSTGETISNPDVPVPNSKGETRFQNIRKAPLRDESGEIIGLVGTSEDTTERFLSELKLAESRRLLQTVIDTVPYWVYVKDRESRYLMANRALVEFNEKHYGWTEEQLIGSHVLDMPTATREEKETFLANDRQVLETGKGIRVENPYTLPDGTVCWEEEVKYPLRDESGKIVGLVGMSRDISEEKMAREILRKSEEKFRVLAEGSIQGIEVHTEKEVLFANQALAAMYGYDSPEEIVGRSPFHLFPPEVLEGRMERYHKRMSGENVPTHLDDIGLRKDQTRFPVERILTVVEWEGQPAVQAAVLDISERKEAEAGREMLAEALQQAADLVVITDAKGVIEYVNSAFEKITGFTSKEALGQTPRILKSGQQSHEFYKNMWETVLSGTSWVGRYINQRKDGSLYHVDAVHSPIRNSAGEVTKIIAVHHDITDRMSLEEQLRQSQKMEAIGQLAGGVAHEFNNLLQVIKGYSELAVRNLVPEDSQHKNMKQIISAADRASLLTSHLLSFTRQKPLQLQRVNINQLVDSMSLILRPLIGVNIDLRFSLAKELPDVEIDSVMIEQVIMNLCVNARDAMPDGGELTLSTALFDPRSSPEGAPMHSSQGAFILIRVTDTGAGIPPDILGKIFNPFFTTKDPGKGTGLGLSMAYGIVEQHKGHIDVDSEAGAGTVFSVYLPTIEGDPSPQFHWEDAGEVHPSVLVAEDDPAVREFLVQMLAEEGYPVIVTADGEEALQMFLKNRRDIGLVVLDVKMPKYNGTEIYREIRDKDENLPIFFSSGLEIGLEETLLKSDPNVRVFYKPYRYQELLEAAGDILKDRELGK